VTYAENLDLFAWEPSAPTTPKTKPTIAERVASFHAENPHVLAEMLRLARGQLVRGATYISVKALWEDLRVSLSTGKSDGYRLNNTFTSGYARMCIEHEPRLADVIELRTRRAK
jgi:hypothetical protein